MNEETMTVIGVPPTYPTFYDYSVFSNEDSGVPPSVADALKLAPRIEACENGTKTAEILETCLSAKKNNQLELIQRVLRAAAYADDRRSKFPTEALFSNYNGNWSDNFKPEDQKELTNSAFAPLAALYHYTFGKGEPMFVNLNKLNFNFSQNNLPPIQNILNSGQVGEFQVNENIGYDFRDSSYWEWSYLGRVSLTAKGTMTVASDGSWSFNGTVSGVKDVYDANADASRGKVGELLTDVLRVIDGKVFDINFQGEHEVSVSGKK